MKKLYGAAAAVAAMFLTTAASAATLVTNGSVARAAYPSSGSITFNGGSGAAALTFLLSGYNTVDGQNAISNGTDYSDLFTLSLNGSTLFSGYFVLGGIGNDSVVTQASGTTFVKTGGDITNAGGSVSFSSALNLLAGSNTLTFGYSTPNPQAFNDESFGISNVTVTGNPAVAAVPEAASWAMMILGMGAIGFAMRRRKVTTRVSYAA